MASLFRVYTTKHYGVNMRKITDKDIAELSVEFADDFRDMGVKEIAAALLFELFDNPQAVLDAVRPSWRMSGKSYSGQDAVIRLRNAVMAKVQFEQQSEVAGRRIQDDTISKEENRSELIKMISVIQEGMDDGDIERKDGLKMIADIRVKLNDKFEIEERGVQKRLIVVPQKRNMICAYTQRECTYWPTKEACKAHYKLVEAR